MADEKKPQAPVPPKAGAHPTPAAAPTPRATIYTPDPDVPSSSEWADKGGPPEVPAPTFGYGSKRIDIFPRPPLDPGDFLNLQASSTGDMAPGLPGMIADKGPNDKVSRVPETDIPFGALVAVGDTGDGYCKVATAANQKILGIAMRDTTSQGSIFNIWAAAPGASGLYPKDHWAVAIIKKGRVWALPTNNVKEGDGVGVGANGALSGVGAGGIAGMAWITSAPANMLAQVEVNLP